MTYVICLALGSTDILTPSFRKMKGEEMATQKEKHDLEIPEGEGRFPWWVWIAVVAWLVYAFLIGPFAFTSPR